MSDNKSSDKRLSRRNFLKNAGITVGGLAVGAGLGNSFGNKEKAVEKEIHEGHTENHNKALMYFTPEQFNIVEAATEAIFPKTDIGPGGKELLVAYFIDHQLAGHWGTNTKEYMNAPFLPNVAVPEQGFQSHLKRQEIFDIGIQKLNTVAQERFERNFHQIEEDEQIEILKDFEADKITLQASVTASYFFKLLRQATIEGVYADPMYGGNKNMDGWRMKNFPGHQPSYRHLEDDKFVSIEPQALNSQHKHDH